MGQAPRHAPAWDELEAKSDQIGDTTLRDSSRPIRSGDGVGSIRVGAVPGLLKQRVDAETLGLLADLADQRGLREYFEAMFSGST